MTYLEALRFFFLLVCPLLFAGFAGNAFYCRRWSRVLFWLLLTAVAVFNIYRHLLS